MPRIWFLDANVLAHWVMARGGVIELLESDLGLPPPLAAAYQDRFLDVVRFFDAVDEHVAAGGNDQFFVSTLALNEVLRATKHEVTAVLAFTKGIPLSLWRYRSNNESIHEEHGRRILERVLLAQGRLADHHNIQFIEERSAVTDDQYWDVFAPILFHAEQAETMDTTLATTAVLHGADYFVSEDKRFAKGFNRSFSDKTGMGVVRAVRARQILRNRA